MALVPFAATKRFENNPAGWGGPDACIAPPLCRRAAGRWNNWWRIAWGTAPTCLLRMSLHPARRSLPLQRSLAAPAALQRFLTNITDIQPRGMARTSRVSAHAHRLGPATVHGRGLRAAPA